MREPTPEIMRDVSARLAFPETREGGPGMHAASLGGSLGREAATGYAGQQFDIFARSEKPRPAGWAVCWSDLMMTMFIMFAALYAFQVPLVQYKSVSEVAVQPVPMERPAPPKPAPGSILDLVHDRLRDLIERNGLGAMFSVRLVADKSLHLVLAGDVFSGTGGDALRPDVRKALLDMAAILGTAPHALAVVGHAAPGEPLGEHRGPWELSVSRAADVAGLLMREGGISASRMVVAGYGDQRPMGDDPGRSRRVELILSGEMPTEPLPGNEPAVTDGFRKWLAVSTKGGQ